MKFLFLINPRSGGGRGVEIEAALRQMRSAGAFDGEVIDILSAHSLFLEQKAASVDRIIVAGGDGTVSRQLATLLAIGKPVGILPLGTGNDLARELRILGDVGGQSLQRVISFYESAVIKNLSVWGVTPHSHPAAEILFCNYLSFGFDAHSVTGFAELRGRSAPNMRCSVWGNRLRYGYMGCKNIFRPPLSEVIISADDGAKISLPPSGVRSIIFTNIRAIMGFGRSNAVSDFSDELLEMIPIRSLFSYGGMLLREVWPDLQLENVFASRSWTIEGMPHDSGVQIDGEGRSDLQSTSYTIRYCGALKILVAPTA